MTANNERRVFQIVQYGVGGVGLALVNLIEQHKIAIHQKLGVELHYTALADSRSVLYPPEDFDYQQLSKGQKLAEIDKATANPSPTAIVTNALENKQGELIVVDVSGASHAVITPALTLALQNEQRVVLANKRPLCGPYPEFQQMWEAAGKNANRLRYETTVGAALPVVSTLRNLQNSFDDINEISGAFSGTLGYLCTRLEEGAKYSEAVAEAKSKGYTEPDPRDDLGGVDVARKALILARTLGYKLEMQDVAIEPLYSQDLAELSVPEFMSRLTNLDKQFVERSQKAQAENQTLRYAAQIRNNTCTVGLAEVGRDTPLGRLRGTDNIVQFSTRRYQPQPLVVQGPGAGPELTASGVLADILSFVG